MTTAYQPRILAVEDDPLQARALRVNLLEMGFAPPLAAQEANQAEAIFRTEEPDLVLLDIHLAGETDGITLAGRLRAIRPVPFIFMTASRDPDTVERARAAAPQGMLTKPYDPRALHRLIVAATQLPPSAS